MRVDVLNVNENVEKKKNEGDITKEVPCDASHWNFFIDKICSEWNILNYVN